VEIEGVGILRIQWRKRHLRRHRRLRPPALAFKLGFGRFCDVSLPVPLEQAFTYSLPLTLQHRVKAGARVLVPFGTRKMTGVVLNAHDGL